MKLIKFILLFLLSVTVLNAQNLKQDNINIGDKRTSNDFFFLHKDGGYIKKINGGVWSSSVDGIIDQIFGTGGGGGSGINNLDNPGFETGITDKYTCTATKCTEESSTPLVANKSLIFTPTVQNDEFKSNLKAIQPGLMGRSCEARVFYIGGDENLTAQVLDGNALVLGELVLNVHSVSGFESVFFACPTQSEITGDSLKGDLQLRVFNEQASVAAVSTFDQMSLGDLIGLVEIILPDRFSGRVDGDGTPSVLSENVDWIDGAPVDNGVGDYTLNFISGTFPTLTPACTCTTEASSTEEMCSLGTISNTSVQVFTRDDPGTAADAVFAIHCERQGVDAKQAVQVYKNIPKVEENINEFSATVAADGTVTAENADWITGNCTNASPRVCTLALTLTSALNCATDQEALTASSTTSISIAGNTNISRIVCQKSLTDFKLPTVQLVLVNQVSTTVGKVLRHENCKISNSGVPALDSSSGLCESWLSTPTDVALGRVGVVINVGVYASVPVCTVTASGSGGDDMDVAIEGDLSTATLIRVRTQVASTNADADIDFNISCVGIR